MGGVGRVGGGYKYSVPAMLRDSLAVWEPQLTPGEFGLRMQSHREAVLLGSHLCGVWRSRWAEEFAGKEGHCEPGRNTRGIWWGTKCPYVMGTFLCGQQYR